MSAAVRDLVRTSGYRPALRRDVQFSASYQNGLVQAIDQQRNRRWDLSDVEYRIACEMNGRRDLSELTQILQPTMPLVNHLEVVIEQLVVKLADMELLEAPTMPMAPIIPLPRRPQRFDVEVQDEATLLTKSVEDIEFERMLDGRTDLVSQDMMEDEVFSSAARSHSVMTKMPQAPGSSSPALPAVPPGAAPEAALVAPEPEAPPAAPEPAPVPVEAQRAPSARAPEYEEVKPKWYTHKRTRRLAILGGIIVLLFIVAIIPYPLYITEECVVSPIDRAEVRAQINGLIAQVYVREGDKVEIGTPLVRLDDKDLSYNLAQAQAEADRYTANLAKIKGGSRIEEVRRAQALVNAKAQDVKFADITAKRQQKLFVDGVASAAARDEARRDLEVKRAALGEAQANLRLVQAGSRTEEVTVAEAELRKVQAEVDYLKKQMDGLIVRSPIAGQVLTPRFQERLHARVNAGDFVCEIGNEDTVRVDIYVPENDADVIKVGQPVSVKVKSYPLQSFPGRVSHIASAIEEKDKQRVMRVETELENPGGVLRPRMSGFAEIDTGSRPLASRIFRRALRWLRVRFLL